MVTLKWKYEPIDFLIKRQRDEEALKFLPMIWNIPEDKKIDKDDLETQKAFFGEFITRRRAELELAEASATKVSMKEALFG